MSILHVRNATLGDSAMVLEWANDADTRAASFASDPIPLNTHKAWYASRINSPDCVFLIFSTDEDELVAAVRFEMTGVNAEISINVAPEHRGNGYGAEAIRMGTEYAFDHTDAESIYAYVKADNAASLKAFGRAGYTSTFSRVVHDHPSFRLHVRRPVVADWAGQTVLVTGGTGSFGRAFTQIVLDEMNPAKVIIYSRDELKQHNMQRLDGFTDDRIRWFIGDVRDESRLRRAMVGVDIVVHAAAMKQVPASEYNPDEAVKTNIGGASNVINAAIDCGVKKVLALSTDKAVNPINLYGATKLVAEKLFIQGNSYASGGVTRFSCTRYGNVIGSRGSVIPLFQKQRASGMVTLTDVRMTRFWLTLEQGVRFVIQCIERMQGGEVFVPKLPSAKVVDLAYAIASGCRIDVVGIRPGEKIHEVLVSKDESRRAVELNNMFVVVPAFPWWTEGNISDGDPMEPDTEFSSETGAGLLSVQEVGEMIGVV